MRKHSSFPSLRVVLSLAAAGLLGSLALTGCRESAPDDLIQEEPTTDALVFVKTKATDS